MVGALSSVGGGSPLVLGTLAFFYGLLFLVVLRVGALAGATFAWAYVLFDGTPLTLEGGDAATPATLVAVACAAAVAGWGFWHARERPAAATL